MRGNMPEKSIIINGKEYDAATGLPIKRVKITKTVQAMPTARSISKPVVAPPAMASIARPKRMSMQTTQTTHPGAPRVKPATQLTKKVAPHRPVKSQTLNRSVVKKPTPTVPKPVFSKPRNVPQPRLTPVKPNRPVAAAPSIATKPSPIVPSKTAARPRASLAPGSANTKTNKTVASAKKIQAEIRAKKMRLRLTLASILTIILLIGGSVVVYLFVPSVSFWVASTRANVRAKLPTWSPGDYRVNGVVESSPGQIMINYQSGDSSFSITQQNSTWDSNGVLENKVKPVARDFQTLTQKGLTIYRFNDKTIWVNGGVLYTISDSKNLSNEDVLKIIDSM
jgi:hypothetical protein